ncbi:hypothetical protein R1flu_022705 [Riccia fluitans]|uniref:Uncharacterized protein n=1 Tax=Riccia fluitans TaxID=41844 RepID=A0ABD1XQN0_9MARC
MGKFRGLLSLILVMCLSFQIFLPAVAAGDHDAKKSKLYIVYMGKNPHATIEDTHAAHHLTLLNVFESEALVRESLVYHYKHAFSGFSAMLTESQAHILRQLPEVVSVFESKQLKGQTTRSMSYLGLNPKHGLWPETDFGSDVIIGVLDSGVWPESEMFNDKNLGPVPARWNGSCLPGEQWDPAVHCNKKIIGARWYDKGYLAALAESNQTTEPNYLQSARDKTGHGTHVSSTAAGSMVDGASVFGLAQGTATGAAPGARIAMYKVLWGDSLSGYDADILAAFDQAILDGVDILSVSIGLSVFDAVLEFYESSLAIGSYHAVEHKILVSISAMNDGPGTFTVASSNAAPWQLTVAASTTDRDFVAELQLGDGTVIEGRGVKNFNFTEESFPIVDAAKIPANNAVSNESRFCEEGSLDAKRVQGTVILCTLKYGVNETHLEEVVYKQGATGLIIVGPRSTFDFDTGYPYGFLSSTYTTQIPTVGLANRSKLDAYLNKYFNSNSTSIPTGIIRRNKAVLTRRYNNPVIADFSSRGPNPVVSYILKPDITAPGVDILAAWPETDTASVLEVTSEGPVLRTTKFRIISGTSMSAPHISGIAALVKAEHPDWSPAAIKSALMTTATPLKKGSILDFGAGQVNVLRAGNPGLIYDISPSDYTQFLCTLNYTGAQIESITGDNTTSCNQSTSFSLNYPSITFSTLYSESSTVRTVTNVGPANSMYHVNIVQPGDVAIIYVNPTTLTFTEQNQKLSFTVTVQILIRPENSQKLQHSQGFITWKDVGNLYQVTSPVSFWNYFI